MPFSPDHSPDCSGSALAQKLNALLPLQPREIDVLTQLEEDVEPVDSGSAISNRKEMVEACYTVRKGWFVSESVGPTGGRAIPRIHFPGDIIGLSNLPYDQTIYRVVAKSRGAVCKIRKRDFRQLLGSYSRLSGLLLCVALIEQTQHEDRASLHLRNYSMARVALFILQTMDRLKLSGSHSHDQFHCPLTQMDVGDLLGLTNVHISRTYSQLERLQLIERNGSFIRILDRQGLCDLADYTDRFQGLSLDWLPEG